VLRADPLLIFLQSLHAKELYIKSASYTPKDGTPVEHSTMTLNKKLMTVVSADPSAASVLSMDR